MIKKAEQFAQEDAKIKESIETKNQAESFSYQLEKTLKDLGDKVPADVKNEVQTKLDEMKTALQGNDDALIKSKFEELQQTAQKIGQVLYQQQGGAGGQGEPQVDPQAYQQAAGAGAGSSASAGSDDNVVDAEFKKA